jgi:hypothetical protein
MRRLTDEIVLSLKDQIRTLRYSIRSEADVPGSALPEAYRKVDFGPLSTVGTMIGTPVIRMADGLFTQVESVTMGLLDRQDERQVETFPRPVGDYFGRGDADPKASFTRVHYHEVKALLRHYGARHVLVSEHAVEDVRLQLIARHGDLLWPATARKSAAAASARDASLVRLCAAIAFEFARARPIQKVDLIQASSAAPRYLLLSPNLYCGMVLALATAIVTVSREAEGVDRTDLLESADAVVDARFDRFKTATQGKNPVAVLAKEFEAVLPFLP